MILNDDLTSTDEKENFLKVTNSFQEDYQALRESVITTKFSELSHELREKVKTLYEIAKQIYHHISSSRLIGKHYLLAALSFFACPEKDASQELNQHNYLILQASYLTFRQHQKFNEIKRAENKQKQVCDLFRYISRYILDTKTPELSQECNKLLICYVEYELAAKEKGGELSKKDRDKLFNFEEFHQTLVLEYLSDLRIIFKRLDQRRVVLRKRNSKKTNTLKWPRKAQIRSYRIKKEIQQEELGYGAKLKVDEYILEQDEDGEIDLLDTAVEFYAEDEKTVKFNYLLSEYAVHKTRHRQRRHAPFITNPHYLAPDVLRHVIYVLKAELHGHFSDASIAAACLLSLLTGLSPVALLNFKELIQDGILIQSGSSKRREYLLNLNLKITQQKIQSLKHVRWNEDTSHQLHLPAAWFDYLEQRVNTEITSASINAKLKAWLRHQFIGSITIEKLQAQLYFHVRYETFDEYLAHVISGRDSQHHMPGVYYGGVTKDQLNATYLCYLEAVLKPHSVELKEDTAELTLVQQQFQKKPVLPTERIGSQLALCPDFVAQQFSHLHEHCQNNIQKTQHIINQLNAYACWMWHVSLLSLTRRPRQNLLGNLDDYCIELKLIYVNDKKNSRARKVGRYIPLPDFFIQALQRYIIFLQQIIEGYGAFFKQVLAKKKININDLFGQVFSNKTVLPITSAEWKSKKIRLKPLSQSWVNTYMEGVLPRNMYSNWLRHFDMNILMQGVEGETGLACHLIQALYGHDQQDHEAFHPHSSLIPNAYVQQIRRHLQQNIKFLDIQHLHRM